MRSPDITTVRSLLSLMANYLSDRGVPNFRRQAEDILCDTMGKRWSDLPLLREQVLDPAIIDHCRAICRRRGEGEPYQYITGEVDFYGCTIAVSPDVLIPRQETELLVDTIAQSISGRVLWDICCGSGCIAIALKKKISSLLVSASDISPAALAVAGKNALANDVQIEFLFGDLLAPFTGRKADIVVCNPPYVSACEYEKLDDGVRLWEPKVALLGGDDNLSFYRRLRDNLPHYLNTGASIWLEIGWNQGDSLRALFSSFPRMKKMSLIKDLSGHDRFFSLEIE